MCLAIPGQIVALEPETHLALVEVLGVRRRVNVDLVWDEGLREGDWVLIHVGFALSKVSEQEAAAQLRLLEALGEDEQAMEEVRGYLFDVAE
ncbi:HypC/HybG/HupF family hydrogenase formation chaperone [Thermomicrobium sp. CFH 73360]|uniref:HypC/HybG/HupF family hydrogenase formation chaperone n=1 Tax=Thermomicrobium roseum TaxID=500 RepID=A0A7C5RTI7_THERO|nr:HypC/HybG/HupF family hydrogenase formation chaperone [Thermomicrobium sp. CFH 73360]MCM8746584.1 HypC/HybG/HupF family hydrogenase formation chaperone [Thermomicrobium sp. CFH 73360]